MDILTHTVSGLAVASILAHYYREDKWKIIGLGGLGGALPDIDAISMWSKFDGTFGRLFNLSESGREIYFGQNWYSHHAITHSLSAAFALAILVWVFNRKSNFSFFRSLAFLLAYILHLLEDMPTPGSTWDGIGFFWPSHQYLGGSGHIWWWNNYDIFLIALSVFFINAFLLLFKKLKAEWALYIFLSGTLLGLFQITTRGYDFDYEGHTTDFQKSEAKSLEIQRNILGEDLYNAMRKFDSAVKVHF
jgi:inner membrane protein